MLKRCIVLLLCAAFTAPALAGGYGGHGYRGHYHGHGGGGDGAALLAGLVIGGLVGYFVSEDRHYRRDAYATYRPAPYYHDEYYYEDYGGYGYRERVYREYVPVPVEPRIVTMPDVTDPEFAGQGCRMTREYTTTIEIDGQIHEAYGTRCLTADGSWELGRPKLVPEFH